MSYLIVVIELRIYLSVQLASHKHLYEEEEIVINQLTYAPINANGPQPETGIELAGEETSKGEHSKGNASEQDPESGERKVGDEAAAEEEDQEEEEDEDQLGFNNSLIWLAIITVFIAVLSDAISASIQEAASSLGISKVFMAAILLPIVGNAAEHAGAVMFAVKGKLDLSLGVAIGSSTQIALCVLPLLVIIGWMGGYDLSLNFGSYEAGTLFLSVISVVFAIKDGKSNWLLGLTLIAMYLVIAVGFWAHNNQELN
jgi:Ca2+:H+ antiporter